MKNNLNLEDLYIKLTSFRETLKLYHFQCLSYGDHKATDKLLEEYDVLYDIMMEIVQGELDRRINIKKKYNIIVLPCSKKNIIKETNNIKKYLSSINTECSDFLNVRDELLSKLNNYIYLLSFI